MMSTSQRKKTLISVAPRAVTERMVVTPGTMRMASSIGRVTRQHLNVHWRDAVVHQNDNAREIRLREYRDRQAKHECDAGERKTEYDDYHRPRMRLDKLSKAVGHCFVSTRSRTCVPSGNPYPPSTITESPAFTPLLTWTLPS